MAGTHQLHPGGHLVQAVQHGGLEWAKNTVKVVEELRLIVAAELRMDAGIPHGGFTEVTAQEVAGKEGLVRLVPGEDGVGPVEERRTDEPQRLAAQVQGIAVLHHAAGEFLIGNGGEEFFCGAGAEHSEVGAAVQQGTDAAGVVGLGVVHDQIIQLFHRENLLDVGDQILKVVLVNGLDEGGLFSAGHQISIIRSPIPGLHHNIEHPERGIQNAHGPDALTQLNGTHSVVPFYRHLGELETLLFLSELSISSRGGYVNLQKCKKVGRKRLGRLGTNICRLDGASFGR